MREDRLGKLKVAILLQCNPYQVTELIVYLQTTISNEEEMKHQGQGQNILWKFNFTHTDLGSWQNAKNGGSQEYSSKKLSDLADIFREMRQIISN